MHTVKNLMSRKVRLIHPDESIGDAARQMKDGNCGMLPVGEHDRLVGTITDRDIVIRAIAQGMDAATQIRAVMTAVVCWIYDDESIEVASSRMADFQVRRLPVVNRAKRLVGIISLSDIASRQSDPQPATQAICGISEPVLA